MILLLFLLTLTTLISLESYLLKSNFLIKNTKLFAQKSAQSDKVRVKLLQDNAQGKKNEIVMVSKAMWLNVLLPKKAAVVITDEELEAINKKALDDLAEEVRIANELAYEIESNDIIIIKRKIGANGQLFGSVNHKAIIEEIKTSYSRYENVINSKYFGIVSINELISKQSTDSVQITKSNENISEIRKSGLYEIKLKIHPKVSDIEFKLKIVSV